MPRKLVVPATVIVYSPKGKPETHTRANARDLVNGAGYTWEKKQPSNPAAYAPFAIPPSTKFSKSKAQEVIDSAVGNKNDGDADDDVVETVIDEGEHKGPIIFPPDEEEEDEGIEVVEEAPVAPKPAPRARRKRPSPAARMGSETLETETE